MMRRKAVWKTSLECHLERRWYVSLRIGSNVQMYALTEKCRKLTRIRQIQRRNIPLFSSNYESAIFYTPYTSVTPEIQHDLKQNSSNLILLKSKKFEITFTINDNEHPHLYSAHPDMTSRRNTVFES